MGKVVPFRPRPAKPATASDVAIRSSDPSSAASPLPDYFTLLGTPPCPENLPIVRSLLLDGLGLDDTALLVFNDANGTELTTDELRRFYKRLRPGSERSRAFAQLISALFVWTTGKLDLRRIASRKVKKTVWKTKSEFNDLVILGSEISNVGFRRLVKDLRAGGEADTVYFPGNIWTAKLPFPILSKRPSDNIIVYDGGSTALPALSSHYEAPRGYRIDDQDVFPALINSNSRSIIPDIGAFIIIRIEVAYRLMKAGRAREQAPERNSLLIINGLHGRGAVAARQMFEDAALIPGPNPAKQIVQDIVAASQKSKSWQAVVHASQFCETNERFDAFKWIDCRPITPTFTLAARDKYEFCD